MPKVSVIIPVYGVEKYIERCARSLFEQTMEDIEFIFVDDWTPDSSIDILKSIIKEYPKRESQTRIIRTEHNVGLPGVRKLGISEAVGDYIIHCDSDDWVDRDMYRLMYETAVTDGCDCVICDYYLTDGVNHRHWGQHYNGAPIEGMLNNKLSASACNKLVKSSIVKRPDYIFPKENICEDFVHNMQYFLYADKVGFVEKGLYYYYRHEGNMTNSIDEAAVLKKFKQIVLNIDLGLSILDKAGKSSEYADDIVHQKLFVKSNLLPVISNQHKLWKETYKEINGKVLGCKAITKREKVLFLLTFFGLLPLYKKIKHVDSHN